jgi:hypothetical protein
MAKAATGKQLESVGGGRERERVSLFGLCQKIDASMIQGYNGGS